MRSNLNIVYFFALALICVVAGVQSSHLIIADPPQPSSACPSSLVPTTTWNKVCTSDATPAACWNPHIPSFQDVAYFPPGTKATITHTLNVKSLVIPTAATVSFSAPIHASGGCIVVHGALNFHASPTKPQQEHEYATERRPLTDIPSDWCNYVGSIQFPSICPGATVYVYGTLQMSNAGYTSIATNVMVMTGGVLQGTGGNLLGNVWNWGTLQMASFYFAGALVNYGNAQVLNVFPCNHLQWTLVNRTALLFANYAHLTVTNGFGPGAPNVPGYGFAPTTLMIRNNASGYVYLPSSFSGTVWESMGVQVVNMGKMYFNASSSYSRNPKDVEKKRMYHPGLVGWRWAEFFFYGLIINSGTMVADSLYVMVQHYRSVGGTTHTVNGGYFNMGPGAGQPSNNDMGLLVPECIHPDDEEFQIRSGSGSHGYNYFGVKMHLQQCAVAALLQHVPQEAFRTTTKTLPLQSMKHKYSFHGVSVISGDGSGGGVLFTEPFAVDGTLKVENGGVLYVSTEGGGMPFVGLSPTSSVKVGWGGALTLAIDVELHSGNEPQSSQLVMSAGSKLYVPRHAKVVVSNYTIDVDPNSEVVCDGAFWFGPEARVCNLEALKKKTIGVTPGRLGDVRMSNRVQSC